METIVLERGRTRATIMPEAGGRLHQLEVRTGSAWVPLLYAPATLDLHRQDPMAYGCFPMAPWVNRIADARFSWGSDVYHLEATDGVHAIHGTVYAKPWRIDKLHRASCETSCHLGAQWPWRGRALQSLAVREDGIDLRLEVHAYDGVSFPGGVGWHPWFVPKVGRVEAAVTINAAKVYELNDMIPTGRIVRIAGDSDLRDGPQLGSRRLDTCYRDVRGPLVVHWGDLELTMAQSPEMSHAVVYTPEHAFCIEPQTCAIDAFNLEARGIEAGMVVVTPEAPLIAESSWRWRIR